MTIIGKGNPSDVTMVINGAIAGLVSITADPLSPAGGTAIIVGAIGGLIVYFSIVFLEKAGVDKNILEQPMGHIREVIKKLNNKGIKLNFTAVYTSKHTEKILKVINL